MKEKIYTIPVTDAFNTDCECPLCALEQKLEDEAVEYTLGPSMMEPDSRVQSNEKGFCKYHFNLLYSKQQNRLSLALVIDTHMQQHNADFSKYFHAKKTLVEKDATVNAAKAALSKFSSRTSQTACLIDQFIAHLEKLENTCVICEKVKNTMVRYLEVIFYLWKKESDFRDTFKNTKGFCLSHTKDLLIAGKKHLSDPQLADFLLVLLPMEIENATRVQEDVNWFTKKFDYRYQDAPWKNSKDAVPRSIEKIVGFARLTK